MILIYCHALMLGIFYFSGQLSLLTIMEIPPCSQIQLLR